MRMSLFRAVAAFLAVLAVAVAVRAGTPHFSRLAARTGGYYGGYQSRFGDNSEFTLFRWDAASQTAALAGRYNGRLVGVAVDPGDGQILALTRDGSLGSYGDSPHTIAQADDRWRMLDLAIDRGKPVALHFGGDGLYLAHPDSDRSWAVAATPAVRDDRVAKACLAAVDGELHILWSAHAADLSRGALRHAVRRNDVWEELPPLPLGDVASFAVTSFEDGLVLAAVVPDPVGAKPPEVVGGILRKGKWSTTLPALPPNLRDGMVNASDFGAATGGDGNSAWLLASHGGAVLFPRVALSAGVPEGGAPATAIVLSEGEAETDRTGLVGFFLFIAFLALVALYCRRSRLLSRLYPGRPADLISRGAALTADWLLVAIAMTAYYTASGDFLIIDELMNARDINRLFWINLAAFSLYAAVTEGTFGRTPGKYLAGLRVRSARGGPLGVGQAISRNLFRAIDMFPLPIGVPGLVGLLFALWNRRRQRVGDLVAGTIVRRHLPVNERPFILASASPRRQTLLRALGVSLEVSPPDIDEEAIQGRDPEETAVLLSRAKASAVVERLSRPNEVVVAADTVVVLDGEVLGKPADREEAVRMLERLSGRSHTVVTGVTVWDAATGQQLSDVELTEVEFRDLSPREIEAYVATGDPMDKAGAYGVQSGNLVKQIRGSLSNVAGLPMEKLRWMLSLLDS